jgi:hypothetical protein
MQAKPVCCDTMWDLIVCWHSIMHTMMLYKQMAHLEHNRIQIHAIM